MEYTVTDLNKAERYSAYTMDMDLALRMLEWVESKMKGDFRVSVVDSDADDRPANMSFLVPVE